MLFKNKYKTESIRLQGYDYGSNGYYFVTINIKDKVEYFGRIINKKMYLNKIGLQAYNCWKNIPKHFSFVKLDYFVIMPNHVHGIIIINKLNKPIVEAQNLAPPHLPPQKIQTGNKFGPQSQNLASIIRGYKIGVTKYATINSIDFKWQTKYYDHIIRNDRSLFNIRNYIRNNPKNYKQSKSS